jgi:hypothetical protein
MVCYRSVGYSTVRAVQGCWERSPQRAPGDLTGVRLGPLDGLSGSDTATSKYAKNRSKEEVASRLYVHLHIHKYMHIYINTCIYT